jgi:golgin subfamily B member 1
MDILNRIKDVGTEVNSQTEQTRERLYYLTYNATIMTFKLC